jgi:hypothetical protein
VLFPRVRNRSRANLVEVPAARGEAESVEEIFWTRGWETGVGDWDHDWDPLVEQGRHGPDDGAERPLIDVPALGERKTLAAAPGVSGTAVVTPWGLEPSAPPAGWTMASGWSLLALTDHPEDRAVLPSSTPPPGPPRVAPAHSISWHVGATGDRDDLDDPSSRAIVWRASR